MLIQFVLLTTLVLALLMTWKRARERVISLREALAWTVLWSIAGIGIASPKTTTVIANFFGVGRGSDFVLYGSVVALFILVFKTFVALDRLDRKLTDIVMKDALKEISKHE